MNARACSSVCVRIKEKGSKEGLHAVLIKIMYIKNTKHLKSKKIIYIHTRVYIHTPIEFFSIIIMIVARERASGRAGGRAGGEEFRYAHLIQNLKKKHHQQMLHYLF